MTIECLPVGRMDQPSAFAIKTEVKDLFLESYSFAGQKTMYGGKSISAGDRIFIFASENEGGAGLLARGVVLQTQAVPRTTAARQTPRVSLTIRRMELAKAPLGRIELRGFMDWYDGAAETELNFKLYRQATNKVVGLTEKASAFLDGLF